MPKQTMIERLTELNHDLKALLRARGIRASAKGSRQARFEDALLARLGLRPGEVCTEQDIDKRLRAAALSTRASGLPSRWS